MPDERARPSLLEPCGALLGTAMSIGQVVLGKEKTDIVIGGIEKGIQDEIDE